MDFEKLFQHPEYENYVCVNLALVFVCQLLKPYTEQGLQQVHQDIKNKLAGKSKCTGTCGNQPSRWCQPCKSWQKPLQRHCPKHTIDWTKCTTANWGESFENIACVFTTLPGDSTPVNYLDLSIACSIWERCSAFKMKKFVIDNIRKCRNKYFAHNTNLRVDENVKAEVFDALRDLLNDRDVESHIKKQFCMDKLEDIKNTSCLLNIISNIKKNFDYQSEKTIENLRKSTAIGSENCEILKEIQFEMIKLNKKQTRDNLEIRDYLHGISKKVKTTNKSLKILAIFVFIAVAFTIASRYISGNNKPDWNGISSNNMANNIPADVHNQTYADLNAWNVAFDKWRDAIDEWSAFIQSLSSDQTNVTCDKRIPRSVLELARLDPIYPVVKVGDVVMLQCTSPPHYTGEEYERVEFKFLHNGTEYSTTEGTESIKGVYSVSKISIEIQGLEDSGIYTCIITPSIPENTVSVETQLYVVKETRKFDNIQEYIHEKQKQWWIFCGKHFDDFPENCGRATLFAYEDEWELNGLA